MSVNINKPIAENLLQNIEDKLAVFLMQEATYPRDKRIKLEEIKASGL